MNVAVAIASVGRPEVLGEGLRSIAGQERRPDSVWVCVPSPDDLPADQSAVHVVHSPVGLTTQRNALIDAIGPDADLIVFIDDDTELHPRFLANAEAFAKRNPDVALFSGAVVVDGARTGPISRDAAQRLLAQRTPGGDATDAGDAYGCCMVVRADIARSVRFDERLPLYGWLEDRDFSVRVARVGRVVTFPGCELVHLGVASGRQSGLRLGFQQIVHPAYLWRGRVLRLGQAVYLAGRPFLANLIFPVLKRNDRVDRPGRLRGNLLGLRSLLARGPRPEDVLNLS